MSEPGTKVDAEGPSMEGGERGFPEAGASRIRDVLLVATPYDHFLLEEEGRLSDLLWEEYVGRDRGYVPNIRHSATGEGALSMLAGGLVDLLCIFNQPQDMSPADLARRARESCGDIEIVYLGNNTPELERLIEGPDSAAFSRIFTWQGDGRIFLDIVQYLEDKKDLRSPQGRVPFARIVLVERSVTRYSLFLGRIYRELWDHMDRVLAAEGDPRRRKRILERRPRVVIEEGVDRVVGKIGAWADLPLCVIADVSHHDKDSLGRLLSLHDEKPLLDLALITEEDGKVPYGADVKMLDAGSVLLIQEIGAFVRTHFGGWELRLVDGDGRKGLRATDLYTLERGVCSMDGEGIEELLGTGRVQRWLRGRTEFELVSKIDHLLEGNEGPEALRGGLIDLLGRWKGGGRSDSVVSYSRDFSEEDQPLTRLGKGPMGGKARGLAYVNMLLRGGRGKRVEGLEVTLPRTLVLCTDIFDGFIEENRLLENDILSLPDERIAARFLEGDLPATLLGDLRSFLEDVTSPIVVRSSSLLEDALFQPFAGVYASVMLSNASRSLDTRFENLLNAIKYVYASTYFERARNYIRSTPNNVEDEKMGVIIQEVAGRRRGSHYYPIISGVARSYDYWPTGRCRNEDGTVNLALGLGKTIVDGGVSFRFCPVHPRVTNFGSPREKLKNTQKELYGIRLDSTVKRSGFNEDVTLDLLDLSTAEEHGVLDMTASTYSAQNDALYPGTGREGARVLDFAPILQTGVIPLASSLKGLLSLGEEALGCPVEIEFAVEERGGTHAIFFLQIRSMVAVGSGTEVEIGQHDPGEVLLESTRALGCGIREDIRDVVYIPGDLDLAHSREVKEEVKMINSELMNAKVPYILIGPGRWGSTDPWLGIPVEWSDIAGVKVVVETPVQGRMIDPSQGSHFFQNLSSLKLLYFTLRPSSRGVDYDWLAGLEIVHEGKHVKHVRSPEPLEVRVDGKAGRGIVLKHASVDGPERGDDR